jgi:molecular chaperone DnaJ
MCRIVIETPVKLNRQQKELLREFEESFSRQRSEHNPRSQSWLDGVREFFDRMTS